MRQLGQGVMIMLLFFLMTLAFLKIDQQCRAMTSYGGQIAASAQFLIEKSSRLR